tara:strand:- start:378 stop:1181 length:804 start_codon:yes stop_codon:yes gene_type:complete
MTFVTLSDAEFADSYETWTTYWNQCRITEIHHKYSDFSDEMNPYQVRWREIPEDEDISIPHPEISVQMMTAAVSTNRMNALIDRLDDDSQWKTKEGIEKSTARYHDGLMQIEKDFEDYLEYKKNNDLETETIDETKPITWESIKNASTEELFQTKLEIFESPAVQETENQKYRGNIRKASSIVEAMYWYHLIVNDWESIGTDIPENINMLIEDIHSDAILKYKLQIFEREEVKYSKNKKARAEIRKSTNLVELFSSYAKLIASEEKE